MILLFLPFSDDLEEVFSTWTESFQGFADALFAALLGGVEKRVWRSGEVSGRGRGQLFFPGVWGRKQEGLLYLSGSSGLLGCAFSRMSHGFWSWFGIGVGGAKL